MSISCWYLQNGVYMDHTHLGYRVAPCCQYSSDEIITVERPEDISNHSLIKKIKTDFENDIKHSGCKLCWNNENITKESYRTRIPKISPKGKYENWDIRPSNICNIKCVMCRPECSSKWYEDIDIFSKYRGGKNIIEKLQSKKEFDWDYVKTHAPNNAYSIYIAGGEPLYDKKVFDFINYLSNFDWNLKNTWLRFNTNGISYTDKWDTVLSKFEKVFFIVSMDGLNEVDEYIRFPTNYNEKLKQMKIFSKRENYHYGVNATISALNFPNINSQIKKYYRRIGLNTLTDPDFLHINSLKPKIIEKVKKSATNPYIIDMANNYKYNDENNKKMKAYLQDLDKKRNTNSKSALPWCWK